MRITENEIVAFIVGAAIGSIVTYWHVTREKRAIASIRDDIEHLRLYLDLSAAQNRQISGSYAIKKFVTDEQILTVYRWSLGLRSDEFLRRAGHKINPIRVSALTIIFGELLGLSNIDACRATIHVKDLKNLTAFVKKLQAEKQSLP
jgi:hypothetical protein